MEIQNKKRRIEFKDVYMGDVFSYNEVYYMRIIKTQQGNAVILENGGVVEFAANTLVEAIEGVYVRKLY